MPKESELDKCYLISHSHGNFTLTLSSGECLSTKKAFIFLPKFWFREIYLQNFGSPFRTILLRFLKFGTKYLLEKPNSFFFDMFRVRSFSFSEDEQIQLSGDIEYFRNAYLSSVIVQNLGKELDYLKSRRTNPVATLIGKNIPLRFYLEQGFTKNYTLLHSTSILHSNKVGPCGFNDGLIMDETFSATYLENAEITRIQGFGAQVLEVKENLYTRKQERIEEIFEPLAYFGSNTNYFHFVTEVCQRLVHTPDSSFRSILLPNYLPFQFYEIIKLLNPNPIWKYQSNISYRIENLLWNLDKPYAHSLDVSPEFLNLITLRNILLSKLGSVQLLEMGRRVYIKRPKSAFRPMLNGDVVQNVFKQFGFIVIQPEELSFQDQADIFRSSAVIAMESGAAFTSVMFCEPETVILEIHQGDGGLGYWQKFCESFGLKHVAIKGLPTKFHYPIFRSDGYITPIAELTKALTELDSIYDQE